MLSCPRCLVVQCVRHRGDDDCCSVVFGTLVGVFVFSVMWSELLMTSAISCPLWSSVHESQRVECAFTSPMRTECGMFVELSQTAVQMVSNQFTIHSFVFRSRYFIVSFST